MSDEGHEEQRASQEQAQQPLGEHSGASPADSNAARGTECLAPLTAPEECTAVTADQGVLKLVLAPGISEDKPPQFSRCLVHFVGRLADSGDVFMDTRLEGNRQPQIVVAGRSSQPRDAGLSLALATMCLGEKAAIYIQDPKYGYGELGSFSFPAVPPNSQLVYEAELVQWEDPSPDEGDERRGLLYEDRLERAERRRVQGNELFAQGKYQEALGKYALALSYLDEDFLFQLEGMYLDKAHEVKLPVHLNMAACQLQTGDYQTAIYNCTEALTLEPGNSKALFRRGRAKHNMGQTEGAEEDLKAALAKAPGDAAIIKELHAVRATLAKEKQAQAQLFKGRLAAAATSASKPPSESTSAARGDDAAQAAAAGAPTAGTSGGGGGGSGGATAGGERQRQPAQGSVAGPASGQGAKQGPALAAGAAAGGPLQQLLGVLWALPAHLFGWLGGVWHACITAWAPAKVQA